MIRTLSASIVLLLVALAPSTAAQCVDWTPGFHKTGIVGDVNASAVFDDGSGNGSELYLAGEFVSAGDVAVHNIVKWNGTRWAPVGGGRPLPVMELLVWNDGNGPVLVAACAGTTPTPVGDSQGNLAKWDGVAWTGFQGTAALSNAGALYVHDDGSGAALYVGAAFSNINGPLPSTQVIARFSGNQWSTVGSGLFTAFWPPRAMLAYDDGSGTKLFVAGKQLSNSVGGTQSAVWTWDGNTWTSASAGWRADGDGRALCVLHSGAGAGTLYAGGSGTLPVSGTKLMRWNGTGWDGVGPYMGDISALVELTGPGNSARLGAGGDPYSFYGLGTGSYAEWDGAQWNFPAPLVENILTFAQYDEGAGPKLFAGVRRTATPSPYPSHGVSRLDANQWVTPGTSGLGEEGVPLGLAVAPGPSGPALYACGFLQANTGVRANRVQRFDGSEWTPVGPTFNHGPVGLHAFDDGIHGEQLYACGAFIDAGGFGMNRVARWDGSAWHPLGGGVGGVGYEAVAYGMITWDDGVTKRLVVFGDFDLAAGVLSPHIAAWDGTQWSTFGSGLDGITSGAAVYDDGTGPALYVGGQFTHAGGAPIAHVARWNGSAWSAVGAGPDGTGVSQLAVYDDGSGPKLYAAVTEYGPLSIERWDGIAWETIPGGPQYSVGAMNAYDDGTGTGPKLCFTCDVQSGAITFFDGTSWTTPGSGIGGGTPQTLAVFDDGHGPALWAAGEFTRAGDFGSENIARFGPTGACVAHTGTAFCFGDGSGAACPCGNAGAAGHGCANSANAQGAVLAAEGQAHLSSDDVTLRATGLTPNAILLYFQGTGEVAGGLGAPFGDGLRCVNGSVIRMAVRHATAGVSAFGHAVAGDPSLSAAGHLSGPWSTRSYQAWYRDVPSFCTSAPYNLSNALTIRWAP